MASWEIRVSITGASETEKLSDIYRHARKIAIQIGIVLHLEGEIVSFIIQGHNQVTAVVPKPVLEYF